MDNLKVANQKLHVDYVKVWNCLQRLYVFLVFIVEAKEDNDKLVGLLEKSEKMKEASMLFQIY